MIYSYPPIPDDFFTIIMLKSFYIDIKDVLRLFKSSFRFEQLNRSDIILYDEDTFEVVGYRESKNTT